jgi:phospholipid N-methyltransferase
MTYTATYSPDDNKLRLYAGGRLSPELYARVKAAGFSWAPKQELFVAPKWTPQREDLLVELCGEIGDEDTSLTDRAEERAERFEEYSDKRAEDYTRAHEAVAAIADNIPLGQPILIGHHSERHARKDAERIENGMRKAVKMWETSEYWKRRAAGALANAKYKERPDVRARRIKGIEADLRKIERQRLDAERNIRAWENLHDDAATSIRKKDGTPSTFHERALHLSNLMHFSRCYPLDKYPRTRPEQSTYEGTMSLWSALGGSDGEAAAIDTPEHAQDWVIKASRRTIAWCERWAAHYRNRLEYERAMLAEVGGTAADKSGPMKGGGCKCWASPRGGWSYIQKVNKVSVTVWDNWGNGGANFTRTIPFDKLKAIMSPLEVENARAAGHLFDTEDKTGFILRETAPEASPLANGAQGYADLAKTPDTVEAMRASLRAGVKVEAVPQLFPTPRHVAERMAELADIEPGHAVLEPSAGTGALLGAMGGRMFGHNPERGCVVAVELNASLAERLEREFPLTRVHCRDFLEWGTLAPDYPSSRLAFDRILMNPPFKDGADIKHIRHAMTLLRPGGRIVAICAGGPRQEAALRPLAEGSGGLWEDLPEDTFAGTNVRAVLAVFNESPDLRN